MNDECIICNKEISRGDIFMKMKIDMRRLIYNETENEEDFLIPDGLTRPSLKDIVTTIVESKDTKIHNE